MSVKLKSGGKTWVMGNLRLKTGGMTFYLCSLKFARQNEPVHVKSDGKLCLLSVSIVA